MAACCWATSATSVVRVENVSRLPSGLLLVEDAVPWQLGRSQRFVLDRLGGMRTPADGALCAQVLTVPRGLVGLEAHRMGGTDALTHFVTAE